MNRSLLIVGFSVTLVAVVNGCKDEPPPPSNSTVMPGAAAGEMPAGHPAVDPGAAGLAGTPDIPALPTPPSGSIDGRIELGADLAGKANAGDAIYVVARNAATGSIIAVSRVVAPEKFPVPFSLSGQDVMHTQTALTGKVKVEARLDKDGDAMTKNPGDVVAEATDLVRVPAKDVVLTLNKVL